MKALTKWIAALAALATSGPLWALGTAPADVTPYSGDEQGMQDLEGFMYWLISGPGGNIIVILGLIVALIMIVASASLRPILFVLGLAILIGWGPGLFIWITGTGAETEMIVAWAAAR